MTDHSSGKQRDVAPFRDECLFCHDNLEAEALGILEAAEHARYRRHLQWCGPCRRDLAEAGKVVGVLPLLSDIAAPSPGVKARLFRAIADDAVSGTITVGNPWVQSQPESTIPVSGQGARSTMPAPSWRTWATTALVAPLAIALIVLGAWTNALRNDLETMRSAQGGPPTTAIALNTTGGTMQLFSMEPSCPECDDSPASGHLGGNPDDNVGILVAWNLDPGEKHQIWCEKRNGELLKVSDLQVEHTGQVAQTLQFPDAIGGYSTIYVTRYDGTEEMRVALPETVPADDATPDAPIAN